MLSGNEMENNSGYDAGLGTQSLLNPDEENRWDHFDSNGVYINSAREPFREGCRFFDPPDLFTPLREPPNYNTVAETLVAALKEEGITAYMLVYCLAKLRKPSTQAVWSDSARVEKKAIETVLVLVPPCDDAEPYEMKERTERLETAGDSALRKACVPGRTKVVCAEIGLSQMQREREDDEIDYSVLPGVSIGVQGRSGSASFGCYLKERKSGRVFGITSASRIRSSLGLGEGDASEKVRQMEMPTEHLSWRSSIGGNSCCTSYTIPEGVQLVFASDDDWRELVRIHERRKERFLTVTGLTEDEALMELQKYSLEGNFDDLEIGSPMDGLQCALDSLDTLSTLNRNFATTTEFSECCLIDGTYYDYMLIDVTSFDSQTRTNYITFDLISKRSLYIQPSPTGLLEATQNEKTLKVRISGRDTGVFPRKTHGKLSSFPALVKFESTPEPFRCFYAYQYGLGGERIAATGGIGGTGNHGSFAVAYGSDEALGMIAGGARVLDQVRNFSVCFLMDTNALLERIRHRWGLDLEFYRDEEKPTGG